MRTKGFNWILFAVDSSEACRTALPTVIEIARSRASVIVFHVVTDKSLEEAEALVDGYVAELVAAGVRAEGDVRRGRRGEVAREIEVASQDWSADLVTLGSRGRSSLAGLLFGSVSHQVVTRVDCPVLVIRKPRDSRGSRIRRVLLAIENEEDVPYATRTAAAVAEMEQAEVVVIHARKRVANGHRMPDSRSLVQGVLADLTRTGVRARGRLASASGAPLADVIAAAARSLNADLIVMGSNRLSDLSSLMMGDRVREVMSRSDRPVLVSERPGWIPPRADDVTETVVPPGPGPSALGEATDRSQTRS